MKTFDIIIIGLGPAGASFARLVSKEYSILALDKQGDHSAFRKPCGGLLAPDAQKTIAEMGLHLQKELLVSPQIFSVHTIDFATQLERHYQRAYFNLDRYQFDRWCRQQIPDSVRQEPDTRVTRIKSTVDGYIVHYTNPSGQHQAKAKYLVGADGANSIVRKTIYPKHQIRSYLAIQEWYPAGTSQPFYASIFDPEITDCYSWALYKDNAFLFGGAYPQDHARERFERQKEKMIEYGYPIGPVQKREACLVLRPESPSDIVTGRHNAFLIGESAGWISPSSLEGISYALISARELARVFPQQPHYRRLKLRLWGKLMKCPFLYRPGLRRWVMQSGMQSIKVSNSKENT